VRGYDTLFVQRVKTATFTTPRLKAFTRACLRKHPPITQLAAWFGVSRGTVYNWMTGRTVPHPRHLAEMKRATELIGSDMLTGGSTHK
jgi:hypothetical protein